MHDRDPRARTASLPSHGRYATCASIGRAIVHIYADSTMMVGDVDGSSGDDGDASTSRARGMTQRHCQALRSTLPSRVRVDDAAQGVDAMKQHHRRAVGEVVETWRTAVLRRTSGALASRRAAGRVRSVVAWCPAPHRVALRGTIGTRSTYSTRAGRIRRPRPSRSRFRAAALSRLFDTKLRARAVITPHCTARLPSSTDRARKWPFSRRAAACCCQLGDTATRTR